MERPAIFRAGSTPAAIFAAKELENKGYRTVCEPCSDIQYVLMDVPSLGQHDTLRSGESLQALLDSIPKDAVILGGGLDHPLLSGRKIIDILKEEQYLKENARITAYCALGIICQALDVTIEEASVLVIGWGRIGKVLSSLLSRLGADVTVASSDERKIASLNALGLKAVSTLSIQPKSYALIINTAPTPVLSTEDHSDTVMIDLASSKGLAGPDVIWARGLPGIHAPKSSGRLIARTVMAHIKEEII